MISGAITDQLAAIEDHLETARVCADEFRKELAKPEPIILRNGAVIMRGEPARALLQKIVDIQDQLEVLVSKNRKRYAS